MLPYEKLKALEERTLANGCTPGEVVAAQEAIARLLKKHPGLETEQTVGDFFDLLAKVKAKTAYNPNAAADAVKEDMARAKAKAEHDAKHQRAKADPKEVVFTFAEVLGKNATHVLRLAARGWRSRGWSRKDFVSFAVNRRGFNPATASTQWQRSQTQE